MTNAEKVLKEKEVEAEIKALRSAFYRIFETPDGKRLKEYLEKAITASSFNPGQTYEETTFLEGQRHFCREILLMADLTNSKESK